MRGLTAYTAEDEVAPFVGRADESTNKSTDNHDLVNEHNPQDSRRGETSSQQQVQQQQRRRDEPINVTDIEDLTVQACDLGVAADELNGSWCPANVGSHAEVGDGGDHGDTGGDVVEDAVLARLGVGETEEGDGGGGHGGADGPVEVGAADGDRNCCISAGIADGVAGVWMGMLVVRKGVVGLYQDTSLSRIHTALSAGYIQIFCPFTVRRSLTVHIEGIVACNHDGG